MLALFGLVLVLLGVLIWIMPQLLIYAVASVFIFLGLTLIVFWWPLRARVTYRRLDASLRIGDGPDEN